MVVVILLNVLGTIFDVVGPFETAQLADEWAMTRVCGVNTPIDTQFEIEHVSTPQF